MTCLNRSGTSNLREINCQQTVCSIMYVSSIAVWPCELWSGPTNWSHLCVVYILIEIKHTPAPAGT
jgi:hypothetical protein